MYSLKKSHLVLDRLLVHRLQDHVAGAVGGIAGAAHRPLAEVARVAAEAALVDLAVLGAVEGQAPVLQIVDRVDGLARQHLGGVLVHQVVATLDGVEHVPLPVVFFLVAQRRRDAALRRAGMRARGIELADDGDAGVVRELHRGHQSRAARADDHHVKLVIVHAAIPPGNLLRYCRRQRHERAGPIRAMPSETRAARLARFAPGWNVMMVIVPSSQNVIATRKSSDCTASRAPRRADVVVEDDAQTVQPVEQRECQQQQIVDAPEGVGVARRDDSRSCVAETSVATCMMKTWMQGKEDQRHAGDAEEPPGERLPAGTSGSRA